jgi:transcriptional regulator with XRE-family HTH domain
VPLAISEVRKIVERVCARPDVLDACARRDLGLVIRVLHAHGLTQGQIAGLTGLTQGRLSEWAGRKRKPQAVTTFQSFADGLGLPTAARRALGLGPVESPALGVTSPPSHAIPDLSSGLEYPATPTQAAGNVSTLWAADVSDHGLLDRGVIAPAAWNEASLRWLVAPVDGAGIAEPLHSGVQIGMGDVERLQATVGMFRELDDRLGGGHARDALIQHLLGDAVRLLRGRYPDTVGSALLSAVAEATLLAAWMTYDSTPLSPQAQRYFIQALGLAQAGGNRLLGASILDAMSHQATYTGRFGEAANLARAGRAGTTGIATASMTAHFHAMEARALARLGDARGCDQALAAAVTEHERRRPEDDPGWFRYFDEAELSAELGHCLRDLGRVGDAAQYAGRSVGIENGKFVRSDFFATMVLADSYLAAGEAEQACDAALAALSAGEQIRSGRCVNYLREFRDHLVSAEGSAAVRDFSEQAAGFRLWRIAARPDNAPAVA